VREGIVEEHGFPFGPPPHLTVHDQPKIPVWDVNPDVADQIQARFTRVDG
jgi:hypothetical protein